MLVLEVSSMRTATKEITRIGHIDEGEWLHLLLADIQRELADQPRPSAIRRIRARLFSQMDRPVRAAA